MDGSTVSDNSAGSYGGGILNEGMLSMTAGVLSDNVAGSYGGGINNYGTLTLTDSTVSGNSASSRGRHCQLGRVDDYRQRRL